CTADPMIPNLAAPTAAAAEPKNLRRPSLIDSDIFETPRSRPCCSSLFPLPASRFPLPASKSVDIHDRLREALRICLRHVVTDAVQNAVVVLAEESGCVRFSVRGRTIEIAGDGDRGYRDTRTREDFLLEVAVLRFAVGEAQSPAIVVNDD